MSYQTQTQESCDLCGEEEVRVVNGERKRRIKWEVLRDSEKKEEYKESMRVKWNERMERAAECSRRTWWK